MNITRDRVDTILSGLPYDLEEDVQSYINQLENEIYHPKQQKPEVKTTYVYHYCAKTVTNHTFDGLYGSENKIDCNDEYNKLREEILAGARKQGVIIGSLSEIGIVSLTFLHTIEEPCK